ncbi:MAG: DMT family transporter [Desulfovibrionaceae bacterium]
MHDQRKAIVFALLAVLLWSTAASVFKLSLRFLSPLELVLWSSLASLAALLAVLAVQGKIGLMLRPGRRGLALSALMGLINPFLYYLILFKAYDLLPAQQAQPINYTWAITLTLLSIPLLGRKVRGLEWAAMLLSYAGVVVIATRGDVLAMRFDDPLGVGLALLSTVLWALYWILGARDQRDPVAALALNFAFGFAYVAIAAAVLGAWRLPEWRGLAGAAYVGVFEMGVTFVFWLMAMRLTTSSARVANLIFLSPFVSLVFIHLLVGEAIHPATVMGLAFIVAGNALQQAAGRNTG